tara:strand:- start:228 stop:371 length:144 start_codon:yes stop_codon:yes gene_type:complete
MTREEKQVIQRVRIAKEMIIDDPRLRLALSDEQEAVVVDNKSVSLNF